MDDPFLVTIAPARSNSTGLVGELRARVERALQPWPGVAARLRGHASDGLPVLYADLLPVAAVLAVLRVVCRGDDWVVGIYRRPPAEPRLVAMHQARAAQRAPYGVAVRIDPLDPATRALDAALAMFVALLRQRSEGCWRALDAVASHRTATAAARELGCSQQAVSAHLLRSNRAATDRIALVVQQILLHPPRR